jgi:hypothetical protein
MFMKTAGARLAQLLLGLLIAFPLSAAPLGSSEMNISGLTLDLTSVERKGNVVTVKWSVRNSGKDNAALKFGLSGKHITTYLVDEENGTKYYTLTDKEGNNLASEHEYLGSDSYGIEASVKPGETQRFWAKFPAPPPAVKAINVMISETEPFEGIAIAEKK